VKHLSKWRKRNRHVISLVAASEGERAKNSCYLVSELKFKLRFRLIDINSPVWGIGTLGVVGGIVLV
jgi:hypothetical protein